MVLTRCGNSMLNRTESPIHGFFRWEGYLRTASVFSTSICGYGSVAECVDGPTLVQRRSQGPLPTRCVNATG